MAKLPRSLCMPCGRDVPITKNGTYFTHYYPKDDPQAGTLCPDSGQPVLYDQVISQSVAVTTSDPLTDFTVESYGDGDVTLRHSTHCHRTLTWGMHCTMFTIEELIAFAETHVRHCK